MTEQILCIEDDSDMRSTIVLVLEGAGYQLSQAEDGAQGLAMALKNPPDLIMCDIRMPGMDGFTTLEELRKHKSTENIPFIFLTGEDPRKQMRKGMNLGANDFIVKPFAIEDLIKAVQVRLTEGKRVKEEARIAIDQLSESITRALPHELRTPMTGILGLAELLNTQAEELSPADVKDLAQSLFDSAVRMNETLEKFWIHTQCLLLPNDPARLSASQKSGSKNGDLIIKKAAEELALLHNRSESLVLDLSPISIAISDRYLEPAIRQVIDNAFKFSTKGTCVHVSSSAGGDVAVVTVKDQGHGMLEDQVQRIQTFMQFDRERHEQQGVGLGLIIAKRLTEIHQGTFQVISTEGEGTTVTLSFPLLPDSRII